MTDTTTLSPPSTPTPPRRVTFHDDTIRTDDSVVTSARRPLSALRTRATLRDWLARHANLREILGLLFALIIAPQFWAGLIQGTCAIIPSALLLTVLNTVVAMLFVPRSAYHVGMVILEHEGLNNLARTFLLLLLPFVTLIWPALVWTLSLIGGALFGIIGTVYYVLEGRGNYIGGLLAALSAVASFAMSFSRWHNTTKESVALAVTLILNLFYDLRMLVAQKWPAATRVITPIKDSAPVVATLKAYDWLLSWNT